MFNIGAFSPNIILAKENMNPIKGGDQHFVQLNMVPLGSYKENVNPKNANEDTVKSNNKVIEVRANQIFIGRKRLRNNYYNLFRDAAEQVISKERNGIRKLVQKYLIDDSKIDEFTNRLVYFYDKSIDPYINNRMSPAMESYINSVDEFVSDEIGIEPKTVEAVNELKKTHIKVYSKRYIDSSISQMQDILNAVEYDENGNMKPKYQDKNGAIAKRVDEWIEKRPDKVATDEVVRLEGVVAMTIYFANNLKSVWATSGAKTCPYCQSLKGKVIDSESYFVKQNDDLSPGDNETMHIRQSLQHPPLHQGCDCYLTAG